ncbi:GNAT family N-acetyltransferase [Halobacillus rhizosphaerae]|uniref:GNAT family N-acetyltransferase n=1 Tax=Halobacillus rhizosphaerae TaxID=3064889 RepID=UPI00398AB5D3
MNIKSFQDPSQFAREAAPLLMAQEAENNLPLGIMHRLQEDPAAVEDVSMLVLYDEEERPVYLTLRTPPHLWILPSVTSVTRQQVCFLTEYLRTEAHEVPGILGEENAVQWFLERWQELTGQETALQMHQGIYRLDKLEEIREGEGKLILAASGQEKLVAKWLEQFSIETNTPAPQDSEQQAKEMIDAERVYLWKKGEEFVSMVCRARTTPHGATVNGVFTPDQFKKQGYASQAVWQLSNLLLREGFSFCALYTDLANPTSNSIYKKIGYQWIGNSKVYHFN